MAVSVYGVRPQMHQCLLRSQVRQKSQQAALKSICRSQIKQRRCLHWLKQGLSTPQRWRLDVARRKRYFNVWGADGVGNAGCIEASDRHNITRAYG